MTEREKIVLDAIMQNTKIISRVGEKVIGKERVENAYIASSKSETELEGDLKKILNSQKIMLEMIREIQPDIRQTPITDTDRWRVEKTQFVARDDTKISR